VQCARGTRRANTAADGSVAIASAECDIRVCHADADAGAG
jgi:hypothetical protein